MLTGTIPDAKQLAAVLRTCAGDRLETAAVEILTSLPHVYTRDDIRDRYMVRGYNDDNELVAAAVMWASLYADIRAGKMPLSSSERHVLLFACSLASTGAPVCLAEVFVGIDEPNALLLLAAIERTARSDR